MRPDTRCRTRLVVPLEMADMKGGMLQSVELLLRFLSPEIEKVVLAPSGSQVSSRMEAAGARVIRSSRPTWTVDRDSPLRTLATFRTFRREMRELLKPGSVLLTNNIAVELLCGLGNPFPRTPRIFVNRGNAYGGLSARALRSSLASSRLCVATTSYQEDTLTGTLAVPMSNIRVIPNGVDLTELRSAAKGPKPSWYEAGKTHIATLGYPSELKNQELLIRAIGVLRPRYPNVVGVIAGSPGCADDETYYAKLKSLTAELDLEPAIRFVPFTSNKQELFAGIDILASTSLREGFGRSIVEAMAAGKPVVAKRAGGPETIIEEGRNGLLVTGTDPDVFAGALLKLLERPDLVRSLTQEAAGDCTRLYGAESVARKFDELIREVSSGGMK